MAGDLATTLGLDSSVQNIFACFAWSLALLARSALAREELESEKGKFGRLLAIEFARPIQLALRQTSSCHLFHACLVMYDTRWSSNPFLASLSAPSLHSMSRIVSS